MFIIEFLKGQFKNLPYPDGNFLGQTVIVTGSNCGLGLEVARHFARLNAKLVILACRNINKGTLAKASIEDSTKRTGVVEVWPLNLGSFDSVKAFCKRAESLDRIDILIANAGIATPKFELVEGFESTITESREKFRTKARIVVVTSDAHHMARYRERSAPNVFHAFANPDAKGQDDRYPTSKLLEILLVHELAAQLASHTSSSPSIIVNSVNPGYCKSELQRYASPLRYVLVKIGGFFVARSTEVGSRTVFAGAVGEEETNGKYMSNCVVTEPVAWIDTEQGLKVGRKTWKDLAGVLEGIEPGIMARLQKERV